MWWEELRAGHPQVCGEMDLHDSPTDMRTGMTTNKTGALDRILAGKCCTSTQISLGGALHKHAVVRGKGGGVEEGHCSADRTSTWGGEGEEEGEGEGSCSKCTVQVPSCRGHDQNSI